jgi:hypothetical protein
MKKVLVAMLVVVSLMVIAVPAMAATGSTYDVPAIQQVSQLPAGVTALPVSAGVSTAAPVFYTDGRTYSVGGKYYQVPVAGFPVSGDGVCPANFMLPLQEVVAAFGLVCDESPLGNYAAVYDPATGQAYWFDFDNASVPVDLNTGKPVSIVDFSALGEIVYSNGNGYITPATAYDLFAVN